MDIMNINKDNLLNALQRVTMFTNVENKMLQILIEVEDDNIAICSIANLIKKIAVSRTAIYSSLKNLQLKGFVVKLHNLKDSYEFNEEKLQFILDTYNCK